MTTKKYGIYFCTEILPCFRSYFHFVNQKKKKKTIDLVDNVDEFIFRFFWLTPYVVLKQKTFILKFTTRMPGFKFQLAPPTMNIYGKA